MILLPVVGFFAGLLLRVPWGFVVTLSGAAVGFTIVGFATDEISGPGDLFVWGDTLIALGATWLGVRLRERRVRRQDVAP